MAPRLSLLILMLLVAACRPSRDAEAPKATTVTRPAGAWQGTGNSTIGFVSDSGRFRVDWETRHETRAGAGTFRLTVHSAVSGRPIEEIADHRGEGRGSAEFADAPRVYNFMVESANLEWSFSVHEIVTVTETRSGTPR
jgi:hypothetical protein